MGRTYAKIVPYSRQDVAEVHGCLEGCSGSGSGAVGVKVNARCLALLEDVQVRKWSIRWSLGTQPRCKTAMAMRMRAMLGRACWNRWSVRDDGLEARLYKELMLMEEGSW